jgi:hypothetical protein
MLIITGTGAVDEEVLRRCADGAVGGKATEYAAPLVLPTLLLPSLAPLAVGPASYYSSL